MSRRILALNPWHGGSHRAFLDGWIRHSRHEFTVLSLPPTKWKWRMRHAAVTFSRQLPEPQAYDVVFCTDMLNLAEFLGLCSAEFRRLPVVIYFHENQLTYPTQQEEERDLHFAYSNLTTALAADAVWFNSAFHRQEFLSALPPFLRRMPDHPHLDAVSGIETKSAIQSPGIDPPRPREMIRRPGPIRLLWTSRWEHDKQPELFFAALRQLLEDGVDFRLSVLGESFRNSPSCFAEAKGWLAERIDHWGFATDRSEYLRVLGDSDVIVSTAGHEFFGIAVVEAVAAGCVPLVPDALAYPETLGSDSRWFHDGTPAGIARAIRRQAVDGVTLPDVSRYFWRQRAAEMDDAMEEVREVHGI
jgi:glycosyltransferase involved in cell wall biosynthesis